MVSDPEGLTRIAIRFNVTGAPSGPCSFERGQDAAVFTIFGRQHTIPGILYSLLHESRIGALGQSNEGMATTNPRLSRRRLNPQRSTRPDSAIRQRPA
jgi:hypothetical protein